MLPNYSLKMNSKLEIDWGTFYPSSQLFEKKSSTGDLVSIITRTKNRPVLLARAFASVLSQAHQNWHLYLVNDGGDQEPVNALIEQYEKAFNGRLTVIHHADSQGMEAASNAALRIAGGNFIIVHDDDDAWHPNFLTECIDFLKRSENERFAAVATSCEVVYEEIVGDGVIERERMPWSFWKDRIDLMDLLRTNNFPPICLLIRKEVVDIIGSFNANLPVLGDWDYNLRIMLVGDIGTINKPLAYYHHRTPTGAQGVYGNSVISGKNVHMDYQVLYRNSMLRKLLAKEPGFAGLLHVLLVRANAVEEAASRIADRLNHIHWDINNRAPSLPENQPPTVAIPDEVLWMTHTVNQLLRPPRWAWRKLLPIRRLIARLRGRV